MSSGTRPTFQALSGSASTTLAAATITTDLASSQPKLRLPCRPASSLIRPDLMARPWSGVAYTIWCKK